MSNDPSGSPEGLESSLARGVFFFSSFPIHTFSLSSEVLFNLWNQHNKHAHVRQLHFHQQNEVDLHFFSLHLAVAVCKQRLTFFASWPI